MPDQPAPETNEEYDRSFDLPREMVPSNDREAVDRIAPLLDLSRLKLEGVDMDDFKRAWFAISFLLPGLHPDGSTEIGKRLETIPAEELFGPVAEQPKIATPYCHESGWPVALVPIAREAWRRYKGQELSDTEMYAVGAQRAGMDYRERENAVAAERKNQPETPATNYLPSADDRSDQEKTATL